MSHTSLGNAVPRTSRTRRTSRPPRPEVSDSLSGPGTGLVGAREENRTPDLLITSELLCHLSYPGGYSGSASIPPRRSSELLGTPISNASVHRYEPTPQDSCGVGVERGPFGPEVRPGRDRTPCPQSTCADWLCGFSPRERLVRSAPPVNARALVCPEGLSRSTPELQYPLQIECSGCAETRLSAKTGHNGNRRSNALRARASLGLNVIASMHFCTSAAALTNRRAASSPPLEAASR